MADRVSKELSQGLRLTGIGMCAPGATTIVVHATWKMREVGLLDPSAGFGIFDNVTAGNRLSCLQVRRRRFEGDLHADADVPWAICAWACIRAGGAVCIVQQQHQQQQQQHAGEEDMVLEFRLMGYARGARQRLSDHVVLPPASTLSKGREALALPTKCSDSGSKVSHKLSSGYPSLGPDAGVDVTDLRQSSEGASADTVSEASPVSPERCLRGSVSAIVALEKITPAAITSMKSNAAEEAEAMAQPPGVPNAASSVSLSSSSNNSKEQKRMSTIGLAQQQTGGPAEAAAVPLAVADSSSRVPFPMPEARQLPLVVVRRTGPQPGLAGSSLSWTSPVPTGPARYNNIDWLG